MAFIVGARLLLTIIFVVVTHSPSLSLWDRWQYLQQIGKRTCYCCRCCCIRLRQWQRIWTIVANNSNYDRIVPQANPVQGQTCRKNCVIFTAVSIIVIAFLVCLSIFCRALRIVVMSQMVARIQHYWLDDKRTDRLSKIRSHTDAYTRERTENEQNKRPRKKNWRKYLWNTQ